LKSRLVALAENPPWPKDEAMRRGFHFALGVARVEPQELELADNITSITPWLRGGAVDALSAFYRNDVQILALIRAQDVKGLQAELRQRCRVR
jgi:hypothetical protein